MRNISQTGTQDQLLSRKGKPSVSKHFGQLGPRRLTTVAVLWDQDQTMSGQRRDKRGTNFKNRGHRNGLPTPRGDIYKCVTACMPQLSHKGSGVIASLVVDSRKTFQFKWKIWQKERRNYSKQNWAGDFVFTSPVGGNIILGCFIFNHINTRHFPPSLTRPIFSAVTFLGEGGWIGGCWTY